MNEEKIVLGTMLLEPITVPSVLKLIKPEYFCNEKYKEIYKLIARMFENEQCVDIISLMNETVKSNIFKSTLEAKAYIKEIISDVPPVTALERYCKILEEKYQARTKS